MLSVVLLCVIKSVGVGGVNLNSLCGFNLMLGAHSFGLCGCVCVPFKIYRHTL